MKKSFRVILTAVATSLVALTGMQSVSALTLQEGVDVMRCDGCPTDLFGPDGVFRQITNTILFIVGIVAVVMLIVGGIRYVVSGGDAKKVTDAKNTVLYAIIGLIICALAAIIVNFVISSLGLVESGEETSAAIRLLV